MIHASTIGYYGVVATAVTACAILLVSTSVCAFLAGFEQSNIAQSVKQSVYTSPARLCEHYEKQYGLIVDQLCNIDIANSNGQPSVRIDAEHIQALLNQGPKQP